MEDGYSHSVDPSEFATLEYELECAKSDRDYGLLGLLDFDIPNVYLI